MEIKESEIIVSEGLAIQWEAVETLTVFNNQLVVRMRDGIALDLEGLPQREIDQIFKEWSRWIKAHPHAK